MTYLESVTARARQELQKSSKARLYVNDPVLWAHDHLGIQLWKAQRDILYSIRDNRATAVAAGHGVGKTYVVAIACAWWIDTHPLGSEKTFIASTAPSQDQVALLWDNIRSFHALSAQRYADHIIDHPLPGHITGENKWMWEGQTIGQGRKPPDNKSDVAFQGRHADFLLAVGDEAVGINEGFLQALGVIATGINCRQVILANPTDPTSAMAKIWAEKNTYWTTMHISVMDSPLLKPEEGFDISKATALSGQGYIDWALNEYGSEEDPRYIARVLGQWAFDAGNNVFTEEELARGRNVIVQPYPDAVPELGCDIARMGKDSTYVYGMYYGEIWETDPETNKPIRGTGQKGLHLRKIDGWSKAPLTGSNPENLGSSERIHELALAHGSRIVKPDASGIGSAVIDGLSELNDAPYYTVVEIFGGAASTDTRAYLNARAEQYFNLKKLLQRGELDIDPADEELVEELRGVLFEYADRGQIKIESKDSMQRRGAKSPDRADAAWYACYDVSELVSDDPKPGDVVTYDQDFYIPEEHFFYSSNALF